MRVAIYLLQVHIISIFVILYYSYIYRANEEARDPNIIDQTDVMSIVIGTIVCSFLLMPWLSEPLIKASSNVLTISQSPSTENIAQSVTLDEKRKGLRRTLIISSIILTLILPVWAIGASNSVAASSQYCIATVIIGSIFMATLGTNLLYLWLNSYLARKAAYAPTRKKAATCHCLAHSKALQIVRDMKAVSEIKD